VPMMVVVAIVVSENTPIVGPADRRVDVCEAVLYDLSVPGLPDRFVPKVQGSTGGSYHAPSGL